MALGVSAGSAPPALEVSACSASPGLHAAAIIAVKKRSFQVIFLKVTEGSEGPENHEGKT